MKKTVPIILFVLLPFWVQSQSVYIPLNSDYYHLIERYEIKSGVLDNRLHSHIKPTERRVVVELADSLWTNIEELSQRDRFNLEYLRQDSWEWSESVESDSKKPFLRYFYKKKSDLYSVQAKDFDLHVNPVLMGTVGYERDNEETPFVNTRGVEVRGMISKKLGFYSYMTDTQALFPSYVTQRITETNAVPNEGYYKRGVGENDVDYLTARAYITFDIIKNIHLQFGYDKNFIGNGYRSLILSDYASNYLFLRLNTRVWKINYQNIYAQLNAEVFNADGLYPKKFFALHHLSMNITKSFNVGLFEAIVFNRSDSLSNGNFDFRYLNPVVFYRSIEQQAGSPDNAVLGLDFKWNFLRRFSLYGQLVIDEFVLSEIRNSTGWRGNKQAGQVGLKYIDAFDLDNLDLQAEVNIVRPYMYSHNNRYGEYSHYNQPLVHPLGANFLEYIGIVRYQPINRLQLTGKLIYSRQGLDDNTATSNFGSNIFLDNTKNTQEFGNELAQGVDTKTLFLDFTASYQLKHNFFIDLKTIYREVRSEIEARSQEMLYLALSIRWNIAQKFLEF